MKLYDPSGSKNTIETKITIKELQVLVAAKYETQVKNTAKKKQG